MPFTEGGPMYCLMSALSTNAKSIFSVTLDVVRITTLECLQNEHKNYKYIWHIQILQYEQFKIRREWPQECEKDFCRHTVCYIEKMILLPDRLIWSSWVRTALTTRIASEGSVPAWQAFLAAVRLSTCHPENFYYQNNSSALRSSRSTQEKKWMNKCVWLYYLIDQNKDKSIFVINELLDLLEHFCHKFTTLIKKEKLSGNKYDDNVEQL